MAMTINTNIIAQSAQRYLGLSGGALGTAMQRLSTGLRVNSAKDDAAGLAIAQRMFAQSKGLTVAARNSNDGISLAQTAEGALGKMGDMLQRARALAVQGANATNSTSDRQALQAEVNQLLSEVDRVAKTTSFNGKKLLEGSFSGAVFQVGANAGDNITMGGLGNTKADKLGQVTYGYSSSASVQASEVTAHKMAIADGQLKIRVGTQAAVALGPIASANSAQERLGQVVVAINAKNSQTGVSAFLEQGQDGAYTLQLRSTSGDPVLMEGFNTAQTGFGANPGMGLTVPGWTLQNTVSKNIYMNANSWIDSWSKWNTFGLNHGLVNPTTGQFALNPDEEDSLETMTDLNDSSTGFKTAQAQAIWSQAWTSFQQTVTSNVVQTGSTYALDEAGGDKVRAAAIELRASLDMAAWHEGTVNRADAYTKLDALLQAPASSTWNTARQSLSVAMGQMVVYNTSALDAASVNASTSPEALAQARAQVLSAFDTYLSNGLGIQTSEVTAKQGVADVNVSTQAGAWEAIQRLDSALDQVNAARGGLGALQKRFEWAVENIDIQNENSSAARGRIMDADYATETATLSRNQVLQQAGLAMLAQANQLSKNVLTLLK